MIESNVDLREKILSHDWKECLTGSDDLGRFHDELFLFSGHHVGIFHSHDFEDASEKFIVSVVSHGIGPPSDQRYLIWKNILLEAQ